MGRHTCGRCFAAAAATTSRAACPPAAPVAALQGWGENDRGVSYTFGPDSVTEFLQKHDLDLICRAHQVRRRRLCACGRGWRQ